MDFSSDFPTFAINEYVHHSSPRSRRIIDSAPSDGTPGANYDAFMATIPRRPFYRKRSENYAPLQVPHADGPRLSVYPTPGVFKDDIRALTGMEAPFHALNLRKIDTPVDGNIYGNANYAARQNVGRQLLCQSHEVPSYVEDPTYQLPPFDEDENNAFLCRINQEIDSVNQPSLALPSELDFTPPANFKPFLNWNVAAPSLGFENYLPQAKDSSAVSWPLRLATPGSGDSTPEPEVQHAHSSVGAKRRARVHSAKQGPYASANPGPSIPNASITLPELLLEDVPQGYTVQPLTGNKNLATLQEVCPVFPDNKKVYYRSDWHECCVSGCDFRHTRKELRKHFKSEHTEIAKAKAKCACPFGCTKDKPFADARAVEKHIENVHIVIDVRCAFCLAKNTSRCDNLHRHLEKCAPLRAYAAQVAAAMT
ncbi:hypothetical protein CPB85DRAFT_1512384 [Mucidula mucida]|nr:hypothetical protein CPB85DRAFT_1512384 [Mucidula mucida]